MSESNYPTMATICNDKKVLESFRKTLFSTATDRVLLHNVAEVCADTLRKAKDDLPQPMIDFCSRVITDKNLLVTAKNEISRLRDAMSSVLACCEFAELTGSNYTDIQAIKEIAERTLENESEVAI